MREFDPNYKFDIQMESETLKKMVADYDPETFIGDLAQLITYIGVGKIEISPFHGLDSPLRQLAYLAALNLSSDPQAITEPLVKTDDDWEKIVLQTIRAKAGYFDLLLPTAEDDEVTYHDFYKLALPVFMDYYNTGKLNYEEQEIDKLRGIFSNFDKELSDVFGLTVEEMLAIYTVIDDSLQRKLDFYFTITRNDPEVRKYFDEQIKTGLRPAEFVYDGPNDNIRQLIRFFRGGGERLKINVADLYTYYDAKKIDTFINLFSLERKASPYLYYTQPNPVLNHPLFKLKDGRVLVFEIKQLLYAIDNKLDNYLSDKKHGFHDRYFRRRGKYLHEKTADIFNTFFRGHAHIHSEYRTTPKGDGQDILILYKGHALIIEIKSGYEAQPHSVPKDARKVFEALLINFKKNIQKGFEQTERIIKLFNEEDSFDIYDENDRFVYRVPTSRYPVVYSMIVTGDKFRRAQIDLSHMLKIDDDSVYPFSVSINDLEIILLTLRKIKMGPNEFFKFLGYREELQGRLDSDDELELWGAFINNKKFEIPDHPQMHFRTFPEMALFYDDLYEEGLGFKNEKNLGRKKDKNYVSYDIGKFLMNRQVKI